MNIESVPANAGLIRYFKNRAKQYNYAETTKPHGTHPDLVQRLWDELGKLLPEDCHAVVLGAPVLLRQSTGIIFALAGGTGGWLKGEEDWIKAAYAFASPTIW